MAANSEPDEEKFSVRGSAMKVHGTKVKLLVHFLYGQKDVEILRSTSKDLDLGEIS